LGDLDDLLSGPSDETDSDSDELTIAQVLRHYSDGDIRIPRGFGWKSMRCPFKQFHKDSRASASVNHTKNRFRCFACGTAGDPIGIIMRLEGLSFKEACEQATNIFGKSVQTLSQPTSKHFKRPASNSESWRTILG
jgi:CHC2 zinc finger